jgi:hypothetical protein
MQKKHGRITDARSESATHVNIITPKIQLTKPITCSSHCYTISGLHHEKRNLCGNGKGFVVGKVKRIVKFKWGIYLNDG